MTPQIVLTAHQLNAIDELVYLLDSGETVVSLTGLAGTGKSSIIPHLRDILAHVAPVAVGAPTHRAAMILKRKGLQDAATIHSLALTPYFLPEYACALDYLTLDCVEDDDLRLQHCATRTFYAASEYMVTIDRRSMPQLIADKLSKYDTNLDTLRVVAAIGQDGPRKALASLGIHGSQYFDGFGPKMAEGILIIDEASMLGKATLAMCQQAFERIVLIGDPGQLPPVNDTPALADIPGVTLTEIHRQAADSPIVQLAYQARNKTVNWYAIASTPGALEETRHAPAADFLTSPLIVWRNATRIQCTKAIRAALGYPEGTVVPGEPLVCRATSQEDRSLGFFNNALFRIVEVQNGPYVVVVPDGAEDTPDTHEVVRLHLEELHGEAIHPNAIPFRFGYCLTAHTAQGGEWPHVTIAKPDLLAYMGQCRSKGGTHLDDGARWAYTALTRAKDRLVFLTDYTFTQETNMPPKATTSDVFGSPAPPYEDDATLPLLTDDIPDPAVPPTVFGTTMPLESTETLPLTQNTDIPQESVTVDPGTIQGQLMMALDTALSTFDNIIRSTLAEIMRELQEKLRPVEEQNAALAIAILGEGIRQFKPVVPFGAKISVVSPSGFPIIFTIQETTHEAFMTSMGRIMQMVSEHGFKPHIAPPF